MGERLVLCGDADHGDERTDSTLRLALTGSNANIKLRLQDISRRIDLPPLTVAGFCVRTVCNESAPNAGPAGVRISQLFLPQVRHA